MMSVKQTVGQDPNKSTAVYERLSRDDDQVGDSNSALRSYFRKAVLPEDKELQAVFEPMPLAVCKECGKHFQKNGKRAYCSDKCAADARRKQTAARVRKYREQKRK